MVQGSNMAKLNPNDIQFKIHQKEREDGRIILTVTVPAASTADIINAATFVLAMQNKLDLSGIKKEDLVSAVIERVGEAQYKAFANHYAMSAMTPFVVAKRNIEPIMEPEFNTSTDIRPNQDFTFIAAVMPKPHYELSSYEPVSIKVPKIDVTDEEVESQIYNLAERSAVMQEDKGAEVMPGSEVVIAIQSTFKDSGDPIEHLTADKRIYQLGAGYLPEEFDKQLLGMKAGDRKTFDYDLPGMPGAEGQEGQPRTARSTVELTAVNKRVVPTITNAWIEVNLPEAKDLDGLRKMMHKEGVEFKTREQENMKFYAVASALAERLQGAIADEIYEYTRGDMLANLGEQLKQQGMTLPQYLQNMGMEEQQFNMQFMMQVRETLRQSFALDALARHLKLTLTDEDLDDTLKSMAPGREEQARKELEGSGRTYLLTEAGMRIKANKWLLETAHIEYA